MDEGELQRRQRHQSGIISRRQVLACEGDDSLIERKVGRREWARVYGGVFVDHTGPLTWDQRAWAAVLLHWPAALDGESALRTHGVITADPRTVEVVVDSRRRVVDPPGVRTRRVRRLAPSAQLELAPPRLRVEDALIVTDVAAGAYSAMERRYLVEVERPHGLPVARRQRQVRPGRTATYRDVDYVELATVVELDGRLGHERDLGAAAEGTLTIRVGWRQVLQPCRPAGVVGRAVPSRAAPPAPWATQLSAASTSPARRRRSGSRRRAR